MSENARGQGVVGMQCPVCHVDLVMSERQGVEVDYCPRCRGVWLDRGELDKIVERASSNEAPPPDRPSGRDYQRDHPRSERDYDDRYAQSGSGRRRKKSWLGDIFEFD